MLSCSFYNKLCYVDKLRDCFMVYVPGAKVKHNDVFIVKLLCPL